jgi:CelD/BcsL family acetyltransferase involved in cellulose biosynthesis
MIFILPLQLRPSLGLQILEWHGYPNVNYGYGVFHQDFLPLAEIWFAQHLPKVPAEIGSFDVVSLQDMPDTMDGYAHPLKKHFNMKAASRSYAMELYADYDALYASKRSSES